MSIVKLNNRSVKDITAFGSITSLGSLTHISTQTANSSASVNFTSGIDNSFKEYIFFMVHIHPNSQSAFQFNGSIDGGSNYNVTKTTTAWNAAHRNDGSGNGIGYESTYDLAQSTNYVSLDQENLHTGNDNGGCGILHLFNPSSDTFVKHFISRFQNNASSGNWFNDTWVSGYMNSTSAINAVSFKMSSGNIDAGQILLFGLN